MWSAQCRQGEERDVAELTVVRFEHHEQGMGSGHGRRRASMARHPVPTTLGGTSAEAFVVVHGIRTADLACPRDLAVIGMDEEKNGLV